MSSLAVKAKIDKRGYIELKKFCKSKDTSAD